jgi:hypothetical protein
MPTTKEQRSQDDVDNDFNRIVSDNFDPDYDPIQRGFDERFNDTTRSLREQESRAPNVTAGLDQAKSHANDPKNATGAIEKAREQEEAGGAKWKFTDNRGKEKEKSETSNRKGPLFALGGSLGIGGVAIGGLFGTGIAPIAFTQALMNNLNDGATALEMRRDVVQSGRISSDTTNGICTTVISVACRYERTGKPFIERIEKDGGTVSCNGPCDKRFNNKILSITFKDGTVVDDPAKFRSTMLNNTVARSTMNRAYNPLFFSVWDKTGGKILPKMGITRAPRLTEEDVEKNKEILRKAGNIPAKDGQPLIPKRDDPNDPNKITGYTGPGGEEFTPAEGTRINEAAASLADTVGGAASKVAKGVVGTTGLFGLESTACEAIRTLETISTGAKMTRTAGAILAMDPIQNTAYAAMAGKGNESAMTAVGELLTERNNEDTTIDDNGNKIANPYKGLTAFDSPGVRTAMGFGAGKLMSSDSRFMVGTPTTGVLDSLSRQARGVVDPTACGFVLNPWVQAGNVVAGIATAIFTGGLSTTKMVAQGVFSAVVSVGMAYAEALLQDMASGNIEKDFHDVGIGNISFVGMSEMNQRIGGARGMGYQTDENVDYFNNLRVAVQDRQIEVAKYDAKSDPFNPTLQYSFAGILARQLLPLQYSDTTRKLVTVAALPFQTLDNLLLPVSGAVDAQPYDPSRYEKCKDPAYVELGIKADIFCNLRRAMSKDELSRDPKQVMQWMVDNGYVDNSTDSTTADIESLARKEYEKFLESCANGSDTPPGLSSTESDNWVNKKNCIKPVDIDQNTLSNFRVFTLDYSVIDGLDNDAESIGSAASGGGGTGEAATGDPRAQARQVANHENIKFVKTNTKTSLENFANTGQAVNSCGQSFTIDPALTGVMLALASKYRIYVGNFGFNNDRSFCDTGQHPKGRAIDINGIETIGGGKTSWGSIRYTSSEMPIVTSYANDWLVALPPNRGGVGQKGCLNGAFAGSAGFTITPPADAVNVNGSMFFTDSCDHLHIDVRER